MKTIRSALVLFIALPLSGQALWAANPALWLKFDETSGTSVAESSGNENSGTFSQAPTWAPGQMGNAATFAGAYLDIPNSPSMDLAGTNLTIAGWMSTVAGSDAVVIV